VPWERGNSVQDGMVKVCPGEAATSVIQGSDEAEIVKFLKSSNLFSAASLSPLLLLGSPVHPSFLLSLPTYIGGVYPPEK